MSTALRVAAAVAVLFLYPACVSAQDFHGSLGVSPGSYPDVSYPPTPIAPYGMSAGYGYMPYDHASTYEEGVLRGRAALARAYGQGNYWNAQAMKDTQEAYRRYLENRRKTLETYVELAQINQEARANARGPRATREDLARYANEGAPKPLTASQFDGAFGVIRWPEVLRRPEFGVARSTVDRLLPDYCLRRVDVGSDTSHDLTQSVVELQGKLKEEINSVSPMEYVAAKKFLESLKYEVGHRSATSGLAVR
jgi:hypothetical protein